MYSSNSFSFVWPDIYVPKKDLLEVEELETYALKNAENHRTEKYELVRNSKLPVLRRSAKFFLGVRYQFKVNLGSLHMVEQDCFPNVKARVLKQ